MSYRTISCSPSRSEKDDPISEVTYRKTPHVTHGCHIVFIELRLLKASWPDCRHIESNISRELNQRNVVSISAAVILGVLDEFFDVHFDCSRVVVQVLSSKADE